MSKISFLTNNILTEFGEGTDRLWCVLATVTILLMHSFQQGLGLVKDFLQETSVVWLGRGCCVGVDV
jgi:hypothetical protein